MDTHKYVSFHRGSRRKLRRRITGISIIAVIVLAAAFVIGKLTEDSAEYRQKVSLVEENRVLREQIDELNARIAELEGTVNAQEEYISQLPSEEPAAETEPAEGQPAAGGFTAETPRDGGEE